METFEVCNTNGRHDEPTAINIDVRWTRREHGGWNLVEHTTGRKLGWITRADWKNPKSVWQVRIASGAFQGSSKQDQGYFMDHVPHWLYRGDPHNAFVSNVLCTAPDRWYAAYSIVQHLVWHRAPAVGFGAHFEVTPSKFRPEAVAA